VIGLEVANTLRPLRRRVGADGLVNFLSVFGVVVPGHVQVLLRQGRIPVQNSGVVFAQPSALDQDPHRDTSLAHTGVAAAAVQPLGNPARGRGHVLILRAAFGYSNPPVSAEQSVN